MKYSSKQLMQFFALTFAWSWTCWLLTPAVKAESSSAANILFFLGGFGPSFAAVVVVYMTSGWAGLRLWLLQCLRWRGRLHWIGLAFLAPLAILSLATVTHLMLGGSMPESPAVGHIGMLTINFFLVFLVGGPLGEELGWRGLALPAMQENIGWRKASIALGAIWGVWHLPLFFVVGSTQNNGAMSAFFY